MTAVTLEGLLDSFLETRAEAESFPVGDLTAFIEGNLPEKPADENGRKRLKRDIELILEGHAGLFYRAGDEVCFNRSAFFKGAKFKILPPGAVSPERFGAKCTSCQLCAANCPEKIIVPAPGGYGPVSLDLSRGHCRYDCKKCSEVCPTGALLPLTLPEKRKTKIAEAKLDPKNCIVFQEGTPCGRCAAACPVHAVVLRKSGAPRPVNTRLCIGCGACQQICPAEKKAMTIHFIPKQDRIP